MSKRTKVLRIGIASQEAIRRYTLDIVSGKIEPGPRDPKVWFTSIDEVGRMLNKKNMLLIETIRSARPASIMELAELTNRAKSNLSRTLKMLEQHGLIRLDREVAGRVRPVVDYDKVNLEYPLDMAA